MTTKSLWAINLIASSEVDIVYLMFAIVVLDTFYSFHTCLVRLRTNLIPWNNFTFSLNTYKWKSNQNWSAQCIVSWNGVRCMTRARINRLLSQLCLRNNIKGFIGPVFVLKGSLNIILWKSDLLVSTYLISPWIRQLETFWERKNKENINAATTVLINFF